MNQMASDKTPKIEIQNANHPGKVYRVDADKYQAMKAAFLKVLPGASPGATAATLLKDVTPLLPADLFPGGEKAGWWMTGVQIDLEAKGIIIREQTKPLRFHRA